MASLPYALVGSFAAKPRNWERQTLRQIRQIVGHAYSQVPFYQQRWQTTSFSLDSLASLADFAQAPLIDRLDWRTASDEEIMPRHGMTLLVWHQSGGTLTGQPFSYPQRLPEELILRGQAIQSILGSGGRLLRLNSLDVNKPGGSAYLGRLLNVASTASTRQRLEAVLAHPFPTIASYPSILWRVAVLALRDGVTLPGGTRSIRVGGEVMTPTMQHTIERVFRAPVRQGYAATELGMLAQSCEVGHLHVRPRFSYLEIYDGDSAVGPGVWGEVVVTNFLSYARPAIRLRTGDRARWGDDPCACGSALPYFQYVAGRLSERIECPDGKIIYWPAVEEVLAPYGGRILGYQVEQTAPRSVTVRLCLDDPRETADQYLPALTILFKGLRITVVLTDNFHVSLSGKISPVIGYAR